MVDQIFAIKIFAIIGALLIFIGSLQYLIRTIHGKIQPNKVSWFLWSLAPLVAFAAELQQGVGLASLMTFALGFSTLLIFLATFIHKRADYSVNRFDFFCGLLSFCGLILWSITKVGNIAIFFSILADELAGLPTVVKAFQEPETESYGVFLLTGLGAICTLVTITSWNFASVAFPLNTLFIEIILVVLIKFKFGKVIIRFLTKVYYKYNDT